MMRETTLSRDPLTAQEVEQQFRDAMYSAGLNPPVRIEADGQLHRFSSNGKQADDAGWYVVHPDGVAAGAFGCWRSGLKGSWRADLGRPLTRSEATAHRARLEAICQARDAERLRRRTQAAHAARAIWDAALPASTDHPYLAKKGIKPLGARVKDEALVIPLADGEELTSLQFIGNDGTKRFLPDGRVTGCYFVIGELGGALAVCVAEGFATGATIHEASTFPVVVAFNAGNLYAVAGRIRARFPNLPLVLCSDDDFGTDGNPGLTKATAAAARVGGSVVVPVFGPGRPEWATDFNDMAALSGIGAVRDVIAAQRGDEADPAWPQPEPLTARIEPQPYPIDALPPTIRAAVNEVFAFVKAPVPLVASSALGALSVAAQAHFDVRRAERLEGPVGLFLLTIADSGERKSTCDAFFTEAVRTYQRRIEEEFRPELKRHAAALAAWSAKRDGILAAIKEAGRKRKDSSSLEAELVDLEAQKPSPPRVPRLLVGDETPENLAWRLAKEWPSAGVVSSEAGVIFGSHGMGVDSVMRNLALLNVLWDGGEHSVGRRTSESFTVRGARLTAALQVQETMLRSFLDRTGGLARGSGFLARFLIAWPVSTQGTRMFSEAPAAWPALSRFNEGIERILNNAVPMDDKGSLTPPVLMLSREAKLDWVRFHDAIESLLASGCELYDVRDVASKTADNAARLAALFHVFENGMGGAIGPDAFRNASQVVAWHLNESRRFFGELAVPIDLANAARLDGWLIDRCRLEESDGVAYRTVQQYGPNRIREKSAIDAAMRELEDLSRARLEKKGRGRTIQLNPALLREVSR